MKQLLDLIPVIAFVVCYFATRDFILATGVILVASFIQMAVAYALFRRVEKMYWVSFVILSIAASLTLAFDNPLFLKWKPTIVSLLFSTTILASDLLFKKPIVRVLTQAGLQQASDLSVNAPERWWRLWNGLWALFFITTGVLNLYVAYGFEEAAWVKFKLFGLTGCNIVFTILFIMALSRHMQQSSESTQSEE